MIENWTDVLDAAEFGPACYPYHRNVFFNKTYSEDCLSVNVFAPRHKITDKLPVVFYVHGGGYVMGDSQAYGYKKISENFVSKNIVFVTLQYRVGVLGFFSSGTDEIPGNLGLWDQTLALQFIKQILPSFGGDVNKITVMGGSAGAASITQLLASPHSNKLFNQAIQSSGSGFAEFAYSQNVVKESTALTFAVGCTMETVKECMQGKTVDELLDGVVTIGAARKHASIFSFQPRFDGDFFPEEIDVLLEKAPKKKTIQGVANEEGFTFTLYFPFATAYIPEDKRGLFDKKNFYPLLQHTFTEGKDIAKLLTNLTVDFYADGNTEHNAFYYMTRFTEITSDYFFNIPVYMEIQQKVSAGWETYAYVIDYASQTFNDPTGLVTGCMHGGELDYVLEYGDMPQRTTPFTEEDKRFQKQIVGAFVNFVKSGNPSTEDVAWLPATVEHRNRSLLLGKNTKMEDVFFRAEAADFWLKKLPNAVGPNVVRKLLPAFQNKTHHEEF